MAPLAPEQQARERIDAMLVASGWVVQDIKAMNVGAATGVAVREYPTDTGPADYILFVHRKPVGVVEAKKADQGEKLTVHEDQAEGYATAKLKWTIGDAALPFCYLSTGAITKHWDMRDPKPRAREVFSFHRPEILVEWLKEPSLRTRLTQYPPLDTTGLRDCQVNAITNLEQSLANAKPRALVQMATGSGKTFTAITSAYRSLKPPVRVKRILFLVDTKNLGKQAEQEFQSFTPNDDRRKFTELYAVQRLSSNFIDPGAQVCISTIQRMYSILQGEPLDESAEEEPGSEVERVLGKQPPAPVAYNAAYPPEFFDLIIIDECHRSIYNLWRQVLEYFDAFLVGLTATPDSRTYAFFNKNVVSEYTHERAVADGVNVGCDLYLIETAISQAGATIKAQEQFGQRDRLTRSRRWEQSDEDVSYTNKQLDRDVVNPDQIRTIIRAFKQAVEQEIYPEREELPKTLIFAKSDSHADDIIQIVREEFNEGNDFCKKVTYKSEDDPDTVLANFRNAYNPRVAVTVDMIATGTDVKPLELLLFMRDVKSRNYYEQMKGRGTRTFDADNLRKVTPSAATNKTHFVIVDAVGVSKSLKTSTQPLEAKKGVLLKDLMLAVHMGAHDDDTLCSLANRLTRMEKQISPKEKAEFAQRSGGRSIQQVVGALLAANDPETAASTGKAPEQLAKEATVVFDDAAFREYVDNVRRKYEQIIDTANTDQVTFAGFSAEATDKAQETVSHFREFLKEHRNTLTALQIYYSQPYRRKELTFAMVQEVAEALQRPPYNLTHERVWAAYERAMELKTEGSQQRLLTDLVSLIRFELKVDDVLRPYADTVRKNFQEWVFRKQAGNVKFSEEQMDWLRRLRDFIAESVHLERDDLELGTLGQQGGLARMHQLFGAEMDGVIEELNETLAA
ncbi:MAG: DEAD/DEAH box helicase family protein [Flavobacteriales bacterium]|nr:DEAD/DEAH box helicase family protein [Flavobacteriales bacterium]